MSHPPLDPVLVRKANEALWAAHPERSGQTLKMPADEKLAEEWLAHYKAAQAAKSPTTEAKTVAPAQECPFKKDCGESSSACQNALTKGLDKEGNPIPEDVLTRLRETHATIKRRFMWAKWASAEKAVAALEHWFNGCGSFSEISPDITEYKKKDIWPRHLEGLKPKLQAGLPGRLALAVASSGAADRINLVVDWKGGGETSFTSLVTSPDDSLAFNGSAIHSRVTYVCVKQPSGDHLEYQCSPTNWISWVEDNYDFENGKQTPGLPDDKDMNELARYGCGSNYQRSSRSWSTDPAGLSQKVAFKSPEEIAEKSRNRKLKESTDKAIEESERDDGAVPAAEPAEFYKPDKILNSPMR